MRALAEAGPLPQIEDPQMRDMEIAALMRLKTAELADRAAHDLEGTGWLPHLFARRASPLTAIRARTKAIRSRALSRMMTVLCLGRINPSRHQVWRMLHCPRPCPAA